MPSKAVAVSKPMRIGIVAGEVSGDLLAAGLMRELKRLHGGDIRFEGIGGVHMQAEGCTSLYPMEWLSLIGFEGLGRLPRIFKARRALVRHFLREPPDLFIGVDVPDFNLELERRLRAAGIRTVHYVSPTVWAWRRWRIRKIRRAVSHMLTLFPFEAEFYRSQGVPVTFVGHPMADRLGARLDSRDLRRRLGLPTDGLVVALLPGSRLNELKRHADLFVRTAQWLHARHPRITFVAPFVDADTRAVFELALKRESATCLPVVRLNGQSLEAMAAADLVLLASGTAALEAALLGKVMVVTYRVSWLSAILIRLFAHVQYYSLPNHLAGRELVPELMQDLATPENLGRTVEYYLTHPHQARAMIRALVRIRRMLCCGADRRAAQAVWKLYEHSASRCSKGEKSQEGEVHVERDHRRRR